MKTQRPVLTTLLLLTACGDPQSETDCTGVDEATAPLYISFVLHNEEDTVHGVPNEDEPDYDGDEALFSHFGAVTRQLATAISDAGATLSFQSDWTFIDGASLYDTDLFIDLDSLPGVEIAPHAHETSVPYDEVWQRLIEAGVEPQKYLGGMTFDVYAKKQAWFDANPGFSIWEAPTTSADHLNDSPAPPFIYRISEPEMTSSIPDLYWHHADSTIIATPAAMSGSPQAGQIDPSKWLDLKAEGRFISPAYLRYGTRGFLASPGDDSVNARWVAKTEAEASEAMVSKAVHIIHEQLAPYLADGSMKFASISEMIGLYQQYEPCLDLTDGMDLRDTVPE